MYYTIYKITNKTNNKIYIGCHKTNILADNYMGSGKHLHYAQSKYGMNNFIKEILHVFDNAEEMFDMESTLVNNEFVLREDTYNLINGGGDNVRYINEMINDGTLKRDPKPGRIAANLVGAHIKGSKKHLELLKNPVYRAEWIAAIKAGDPGQGFRGKTHTDESKHKMSIAAKERLKDPTKNSNYGNMWIYNPVLSKSKTILKTEIIPEGWKKGRKMY